MKKRTNPKVEAMRDRSLMVESERQNHERNYSLNEQKEYKDIEDIKSDVNLGDLIDSGVKIYEKSVEKWGESNFIIKKDKENNVWLSHKIGDESDKIELSLNEQIHVDDDQTTVQATVKIPLGGDDFKRYMDGAPIAVAAAIVAVGVGKLIEWLRGKQKDKIVDLFRRIELVVEKEITAEEKDCLERTNKPIKLINLKSIWNKEKDFNVWLSKCITDNNKLSKIIADTSTILETYKQGKINKKEERQEKRDSRKENR
jgi:hypothetical protein